jgi:intein/homing endonuclease
MRNFINENKITKNIFEEGILYKRTNSKRMNYFTLNKHIIEPILKNRNKINQNALIKINWLNRIVNSKNLIYYEIKEKVNLGMEKELIDLSIPKTKNFLANGLIVHNSIAAGCKVPEEKLEEFLEILEIKLENQIS